MKTTINENKFYQALEDIFTGAEIEWESGYVNLLKIKQYYYQKILQEFKNQVDQNSLISGDFKEDFFDKLYSFFEKYFSESGSVYFVKTANWQRVYEKIYTDNKDVVLFWKTHMLYYVKSDILFQSINVDIDDEQWQTYKFYFDVWKLEQQQNNEKKEIIFEYRETQQEENQNIYVFDVMYSEKWRTTKKEQISKKTKISEEILEKAFKTFKKQSEVDFFINKNAQKFLEEQLDLYLHQILLDEKNKFLQQRLDQLKTIKEYAKKIISFISQFEDELVKVWNKPKFAKNSNYVITIDKLSDEILEKIKNHSNLKEQIQEWKDLWIVWDDFAFSQVLEKNLLWDNSKQEYKYLPIDTKYFKDLELDILWLFDDIDEELDGRLIHSENYQALNTLQNKYREKIQCCYIDPPYNTWDDWFVYRDNFKSSSWMTFMENRLYLLNKLLTSQWSVFVSIGEEEKNNLFHILNSYFVFFKELIWESWKPYWYKATKTIRPRVHETIFHFTKTYNNNYNPTYTENLSWEWNYILTSWIIKAEENRIFSLDWVQGAKESVWFWSWQKPEKLISKIFNSSINLEKNNNIVMDFFAGSWTSCSVAHKIWIKYLWIELWHYFSNFYYKWNKKNKDYEKCLGILGRMKWVLYWDKTFNIDWKQRKSSLSNDINFNWWWFFKYYELEQYEDTLRNMKYSQWPATIFNNKNPFEQYIFFADQKFADVLETDQDKIQLHFENLYSNIDLPETISNLFWLPIKKITTQAVILKDPDSETGEREIKTDTSWMSQEEKLELVRIIKPLLWWGE